MAFEWISLNIIQSKLEQRINPTTLTISLREQIVKSAAMMAIGCQDIAVGGEHVEVHLYFLSRFTDLDVRIPEEY